MSRLYDSLHLVRILDVFKPLKALSLFDYNTCIYSLYWQSFYYLKLFLKHQQMKWKCFAVNTWRRSLRGHKSSCLSFRNRVMILHGSRSGVYIRPPVMLKIQRRFKAEPWLSFIIMDFSHDLTWPFFPVMHGCPPPMWSHCWHKSVGWLSSQDLHIWRNTAFCLRHLVPDLIWQWKYYNKCCIKILHRQSLCKQSLWPWKKGLCSGYVYFSLLMM